MLSLEQVVNESLWVAKMNGYRKAGTYPELQASGCLDSDELRDVDLAAKQPKHLQAFFDEMWAWERSPEGRWMTLPEYYKTVYEPKQAA